MVKVGNVFSLFSSTPQGRITTSEIYLDEKGIVSDKHYNKDVERSVLITSLESYELVKNSGIDISFGSLGENLLIDYNPYHLTAGSRLKIGETTLEISQHCTLCKSLSSVDAKLPKLLKNDRGIFAKVVELGSIKSGDSIYLLT
jgi:MOSC domain-containing protein YiiM